MNKLIISAAALALSAGVAFAENPYVGRDDVIQSGPQAGQSLIDHGTTASISNRDRVIVKQSDVGYSNPAADRFGDAAPRP